MADAIPPIGSKEDNFILVGLDDTLLAPVALCSQHMNTPIGHFVTHLPLANNLNEQMNPI
jgi:hypothetical protein